MVGELVGDRSGLSAVAEVITDSAISALEAAIVGFAVTIAIASEGTATDGNGIVMTVSIAAMAMTMAALVTVAALVTMAALEAVAALVTVAAMIMAMLVSPGLSLLFVKTKAMAINVVESCTVKALRHGLIAWLILVTSVAMLSMSSARGAFVVKEAEISALEAASVTVAALVTMSALQAVAMAMAISTLVRGSALDAVAGLAMAVASLLFVAAAIARLLDHHCLPGLDWAATILRALHRAVVVTIAY
jgi:hypothetical protein